ncbi:uncharacterized protein M6B38_301535 [Iris pallida]|uniref:Uncharacterized protein n=1 Tax=Iris pallida TaxID=29817 RepID=A0AAX6HN71_IRIPA|nr:uncharacterized protein M6B38_301535 [Iris pallida]
MAADSSMGFAHGLMQSASRAKHMVSFANSGGFVGPSQIQIQTGSGGGFGYGLVNGGGNLVQAGHSSSNTVAVAGSRQEEEEGLTPEWTLEEQIILNRALVKYSTEHSMMKYIKVAAVLPKKTVRDVALRCQWLSNHNNVKRQRFEELLSGKRMEDKKEKVVESCYNESIPMVNILSYPLMFDLLSQNDQFSCEVPVLDDATQQLMDRNIQILNQISINLAASKTQENVELFYLAKLNFATILDNMSNMPGKIRLMPPLSVPVNDGLMNDMILSQRQCPVPLSQSEESEHRRRSNLALQRLLEDIARRHLHLVCLAVIWSSSVAIRDAATHRTRAN